ncbi:MAG: TrbI/VirB10 family protein [Bryobacterales bacterium]|nr:TrbI/VirB10 family protein [Bryobacterales bacterium]
MEERPDNEKQNEPQVEPTKPAEPAENVLGTADEPEPEQERRPKSVAAVFRDAFERARHGQKRAAATRAKSNPLVSDRSARNRDRTKTLFVSVVGLVAVLIIFLGVFSSSHTETKREQGARRNPSLGRPEDQARKAGSVTPLLSAETNGQDAGNGQLTPEDINNTSRPRAAGEAARSAPAGARARAARPNSAHALNNVPFTDPALEAYRQQLTASTATPPPAVTTPAPAQPALRATSESDVLGKASLVYVRTHTNSGRSAPTTAQVLPAVATGELAFLDRQVWSGLPAGTRLVARLQTAVSTAVKAPVVAVIETHYERDGEIVLPAGSKAFGDLESGTRSGYVGIRFHTLQMPDGTTEKIEAGAMSLSFGPLKGQVTGRNRGKQFLARALTGVGTVAAFAVGHPGGLTGPIDNSILLRDRISQNIGMAGEQEVMNLAYSQEIVVTVPGNTRFFIVLQQGVGREGAKSQPLPAGRSGQGNTAVASTGARPELPTAAELRELISLKQELNRMYREVAATRSTAPSGAPSQ